MIRSGIRFDYLLADPDDTFFKELCQYHVSGQLRVAPEHVSDEVLKYMGKPKHAVYENQRTLKAVDALKAGNLEEFGKLMNASHVSLRDDYEVTGIELDTLVENAWEQEGVIGSRMTGAGFGGCTVSIVKTDCVDKFIENVGKAYLEKIGYAADFYVVEIGDGGRVLA